MLRSDSAAEEIMSGRADFLVELRGFEPMAIAMAIATLRLRIEEFADEYQS